MSQQTESTNTPQTVNPVAERHAALVSLRLAAQQIVVAIDAAISNDDMADMHIAGAARRAGFLSNACDVFLIGDAQARPVRQAARGHVAVVGGGISIAEVTRRMQDETEKQRQRDVLTRPPRPSFSADAVQLEQYDQREATAPKRAGRGDFTTGAVE